MRSTSLVDGDIGAVLDQVGQARDQLDHDGPAGLHAAKARLEALIDQLAPLATDEARPLTTQRLAAGWRARLSMHLLAVSELEIAGIDPVVVTGLLRRGMTDAAATGYRRTA